MNKYQPIFRESAYLPRKIDHIRDSSYLISTIAKVSSAFAQVTKEGTKAFDEAEETDEDVLSQVLTRESTLKEGLSVSE